MERERPPRQPDFSATDRLHIQDAVMRGQRVRSSKLAPAAISAARRTRRRLVSVMVALLGIAIAIPVVVALVGADGEGADLLRRLALFLALLTLPFAYVLYVQRRAERQNAALLEDEEPR